MKRVLAATVAALTFLVAVEAAVSARPIGPPPILGGSQPASPWAEPLSEESLGVLSTCSTGYRYAEYQWPTIPASLELRIPPAWSARRLEVHCVRSGPGVLVSNLDATSFARDVPTALGGCTTRWEVEGAPRHFVLVDVSRFQIPDCRINAW